MTAPNILQRLDAKVVQAADQFVAWAWYHFELPRTMLLNIATVVWMAISCLEEIVTNGRVDTVTAGFFLFIATARALLNVRERGMKPEDLNRDILERRESKFGAAMRWFFYAVFLGSLPSPLLVKTPGLDGFSLAFWAALELISFSLYPMGPPKERRQNAPALVMVRR